MKEWVKSGTPWIWGTAGGLALALVLVFGVLWLTAARGLVYFWPSQVVETTLSKGRQQNPSHWRNQDQEESPCGAGRSGFNIPVMRSSPRATC